MALGRGTGTGAGIGPCDRMAIGQVAQRHRSPIPSADPGGLAPQRFGSRDWGRDVETATLRCHDWDLSGISAQPL